MNKIEIFEDYIKTRIKRKIKTASIVHDRDFIINCHDFGKSMIVYFLVKDNDVVYVGRTETLKSRMYHHSRQKDFDYAFIVICDNGATWVQIEFGGILFFTPKLNKFVPKSAFS